MSWRASERGRWMERAVDARRFAAAAEYETPEALVAAAGRMRGHGYERIDAFTPYEVAELEEALGARRTRLPAITLAAALLGAVLGYGIQWWTNAVDYPIAVGGRPLHAAPAFIPITFEAAVLFGGIATFLAVFSLSRLLRLWAPIDEMEGFHRASIDRFWLAVDRRDARFDETRTAAELEATAPLRVVSLPDWQRGPRGPEPDGAAPGGGASGGREPSGAGSAGPAPNAPRAGGLASSAPIVAFVALALPLLAGCDVAGPEPNFSLERMIHQPRYDAWEASTVFADGKVMREPPPGTVHRGRPRGAPDLVYGRARGAWSAAVVPDVDARTLARGRDRFEIYCAPCHGVDGQAQTHVAESMSLRPPPPLVAGPTRALAPGRVFHVATYGYGLMPAYGDLLSIEDRWAVVAWIEVLRLRHAVPFDALSTELRERAVAELGRAGPAPVGVRGGPPVGEERRAQERGDPGAADPDHGAPEPGGSGSEEPNLPGDEDGATAPGEGEPRRGSEP